MKKSALVVTLLLLSVAAFAGDDERRCPSRAEECVTRIREMMTGQKFLGLIFYDSTKGIFVKSVVEGSPADEAGVRAGDFIIGIEGKDVSDGNVATFKKLFGAAQKQGRVTLEIRRGESTLTATANLREITEDQITRIIAAHMDAAHTDHKVTAGRETNQP